MIIWCARKNCARPHNRNENRSVGIFCTLAARSGAAHAGPFLLPRALNNSWIMTAETCLPQDLRANSFLMSRSSRDGILGDRPMNSSSHQHAIYTANCARCPFRRKYHWQRDDPRPLQGDGNAGWCLPVRRAWRSSKQPSSLSAVVFAPCFHALQRRCCCWCWCCVLCTQAKKSTREYKFMPAAFAHLKKHQKPPPASAPPGVNFEIIKALDFSLDFPSWGGELPHQRGKVFAQRSFARVFLYLYICAPLKSLRKVFAFRVLLPPCPRFIYTTLVRERESTYWGAPCGSASFAQDAVGRTKYYSVAQKRAVQK